MDPWSRLNLANTKMKEETISRLLDLMDMVFTVFKQDTSG